jgi:hypothetical protein
MSSSKPTRDLDVQEELIQLVGKPFWVYRGPVGEGAAAEGFNSAFRALEREFKARGPGPIGLCVRVDDRDQMRRRQEAVWPDTQLTFAGYTPDDRQLRIRYFWGATIDAGRADSMSIDDLASRDWQVEDRYRIEPLAESTMVTPEDVLALWAREGVVSDAAARRRIDQVHLVGVAGEREVAGISTIYLDPNPRLRMDLWNYRTFVASGHRHSSVAAQLLFRNLEILEGRFTSGQDTRAQGILFEVENADLMSALNTAVWPRTGYTFIGVNPLGAHIRVRYFEGARVPPPAAH